jgi:hypothetical protein
MFEKTSKKTLEDKEETPKVIVFDAKVSFSEALWNFFEAVCEFTKMTKTQFIKMALQRELQNQLQFMNFFKECYDQKLWEEALSKTKELYIVHGSKAKTQGEAKAQGVV